MFRRAWWRAVPSELLIPIAVAAVLDVASLLVPSEYGGASTSHFEFGSHGTGMVILVPLVYLVSAIIGANAMRSFAMKRGDLALDGAITIRVTWVAVVQLLSCVVLWMLQEPGEWFLGLLLGYPVLQIAAMLLLASAYARVAARIQLAGAVDAF